MNEDIALTSQKFSENALDAMDNWHYQVHDAAMLDGLPQDVIDAAAQAASEAVAQSAETDSADQSNDAGGTDQSAQAGWRLP